MAKYGLIFVIFGLFSPQILAKTPSKIAPTSRKIGIIDLDKIQAPYRKKIDAQLSKIGETLHAEFSEIEKDLRKEKDFLDEEKVKVDQNIYPQEKMVALQEQIDAFEKKVQSALKKEEDKRSELRKNLEHLELKFSEALQQVVQDVAVESQVEIILPKSVTLYYENHLNLTDRVSERLLTKTQEVFAQVKGF